MRNKKTALRDIGAGKRSVTGVNVDCCGDALVISLDDDRGASVEIVDGELTVWTWNKTFDAALNVHVPVQGSIEVEEHGLEDLLPG